MSSEKRFRKREKENVVTIFFVVSDRDKDEDLRERDDLRRDRKQERQRDRNLMRAAPDRRYCHLHTNRPVPA